MKRKITAILMTAALMLTMAACAGNSTADTGVESSASSAVTVSYTHLTLPTILRV